MVAAALQELGDCVCAVATGWEDLFLRLSGKTSLAAVRQPRSSRAERSAAWSTVATTRDLRWISACLTASGPHTGFGARALRRGVDPWSIPFLHDSIVVVDGRWAHRLVSAGRLARLLYALRHPHAYRRALSRRVRAIAFHHHYVAVAQEYNDMFLCTLWRAAATVGVSCHLRTPTPADES